MNKNKRQRSVSHDFMFSSDTENLAIVDGRHTYSAMMQPMQAKIYISSCGASGGLGGSSPPTGRLPMEPPGFIILSSIQITVFSPPKHNLTLAQPPLILQPGSAPELQDKKTRWCRRPACRCRPHLRPSYPDLTWRPGPSTLTLSLRRFFSPHPSFFLNF